MKFGWTNYEIYLKYYTDFIVHQVRKVYLLNCRTHLGKKMKKIIFIHSVLLNYEMGMVKQ